LLANCESVLINPRGSQTYNKYFLDFNAGSPGNHGSAVHDYVQYDSSINHFTVKNFLKHIIS